MTDYIANEILKKNQNFDKEYKIINQNNGNELWVNGKGKLVFDKNNKPIKLIGTISNINEQKLIEEKLLKLSQAVEQSPISIVITDLKGTIQYVNPKFVEITGYSTEEVLGQNPRILKSGYTTQNEYKNLWSTISAGEEWHGEFHNKRKNGEFYWESATISPIINPDGITTHFIAIKEDITYKKNSEILLQQKNHEIEIQNEELKLAKNHAEESDRLKSAFLANMSHEIRTPMNGILGFVSLLKEPMLSGEQQKEYIDIIEKSGVRMLNIINDIVDISKIEAGLMKVTLSASNINDQIDYIYTFFKPEVEGKKMSFSCHKNLSSEDSIILTDREKIFAILINLVKNAIKYSFEGKIEFGYKKKGDFLEFFVKDSGIGIPKERQNDVFERFIQADITDKMAKQGAGLGLSISKAFVEMLGGKIWVKSKESKGSEFYFTIPYNTTIEQKPIIENVITDEEIEIHLKKLKILIAEDDEISKLFINKAIQQFSKEIINVSNGADAIDACLNNPDIDLVMMDMKMPIMTGFDATKLIRGFNKEVIIIAQTAYGLSDDILLALNAGCNNHISKPINKHDLLMLLNKYFKE
jgi:PAS domain S-box-containing protein